MCTTFLGLEMLAALPDGLDLIGLPRLVRLNPNVPWRTRGNGAVAFEVGAGEGEPRTVGEFEGVAVDSYPGASADERGVDGARMLEALAGLVEELAHHDRDGTDPGLVISPGGLPDEIYWTGVRGVHGIDDIRAVLDDRGCKYKAWGNGRGLIGATCAIAWPGRSITFEASSYRRHELWGCPRDVDIDAVRGLDRTFDTFNSFDPEVGRALAVPNTPCPVLMGVRGETLEGVERALRSVRTEEPLGRLVWATNHGTDDHITEVGTVPEVGTYMSVSLSGSVVDDPRTIRGGHVIFPLGDGASTIDVAAYEPTKDLRAVAANLRRGDAVTVFGGVRESPLTINLEKLRIDSTVDRLIKSENPLCDACGKHMKSKGRGAGYRCQVCGATASEDDAVRVSARAPGTGWHEASLSAQRHLTMPLKRLTRC
jgi:tRNA(Ile2)-agmatinylcytidine synthase